ncbi:Beta-catenin protein 1 [Fasciola gigantica]|uniref:Beta-catenin-like protein 1 n=1 Tax=Fasciola gigantica TaxID=46835 RepID=A0A504WWC6_FASGI|nr:Beta-catenin protein 1 [Fasciola gigantica]
MCDATNVSVIIARHPIAGSSTTEVDDEDDGIPTTVGASEVDESTIRRLTLLLEKRALVNQEARTKFPDQPKRFMQSEVDLQETLEEMQLTRNEEGRGRRGAQNVRDSVELHFLFSGIVENLLDVRPEMNVTMSNQGLFSWLLRRIQRKPAFDRNKLYVSELLSILLQLDETNRRHLGQVDGIDILLQQLAVYKRHDPASREEMELMHNLFDCLCSALMLPENKDRFLKGEGIQLMNLMLREKHMSRDSALRVLDYALCLVAPTSTASASSSTENDPEMPAKSSINADPEAVVVANCSKFVEVLGLRTIFPLFMHSPRERLAPGSIGPGMKKKTLGGPSAAEMEEHIINIIGALLRHCPIALKSRLLAKFVESDHEKVDRLVELHLKYFAQVKSVDSRIRAMREDKQRWTGYTPEEIEDELMVEHLSSGLLALQMLDIIALDICVNGAPTVRNTF